MKCFILFVLVWSSFVCVQEKMREMIPSSALQQQKLRVCEVCGSYLGIYDNDRRLADHFGGKLHMGFVQLRNSLDTLRVYTVHVHYSTVYTLQSTDI